MKIFRNSFMQQCADVSTSLQAYALQLYVLCAQGVWSHMGVYEAHQETINFIGVFLLCNASRKKTIETLVDREGVPGGMLAQILDNVPELLIRFMTRCPEENQGEALRMLKALMEKEALPVSFPMALLCMGITQQVSERIKAQMLDEILNLLCYCKMPGLISAAWTLHNLFYVKCSILDEENLRKVDDCLLLLVDVLYKNTENGLSFKDVLHMRKACVSIAFQMQQLIGATEDYAGVRRWEEVAIDSEEMNEIKDEWVF